MNYYLLAFKNIFNYKGEASIKEFWFFILFNMIITIGIRQLVYQFELSEYIFNTYRFISVLALLPLGFRRLKNAGFSGWLFLIPLVNIILAGLPEKENKYQ